MQPISGKWHFAVKTDFEGRISEYRARFVARGFSQTQGLDYFETYAPTARLSTLRTMLACGVQQGVNFRQLDIKTAYLNAPIDEEIYLEQPEGFKKGRGDLVCRLKRSLYGFMQSGRNWFQCLSELLQSLEFTSSEHDRCLWTLRKGAHTCWVLEWVDDLVYGSTDHTFAS